MKCSRGDAQIGGYPPLPLKKIGRRNGACAPCWVLLSKKYRSQRLVIFRRPSPAVTREISRRDACGNLPHLSTWVSADLPAKHQKPAAWSPEEPVQQSGHRYRWSATSERCKTGSLMTQLPPFRLLPSRVPAPRPSRYHPSQNLSLRPNICAISMSISSPRCHGEDPMKIPVMPHSNAISSAV